MDEPTTQARRKPQEIRYLDAEWERVVTRARACGMPPATFVRKVSLGVKLRSRRNRTADALIVELGRVCLELQRLAQTAERAGEGAARAEWMEAPNLPTADPETASLLMRATAAQSDRVRRPVYHLALSFDPEDPVDRATMVRVADRLLVDLGIQEHQVLIVAHGDTAHRHLHLMINRVHPGTFRAWDPRSDYQQIERSLRVQERELGLREVAGHHARLEGQREPERAESLRRSRRHAWPRAPRAEPWKSDSDPWRQHSARGETPPRPPRRSKSPRRRRRRRAGPPPHRSGTPPERPPDPRRRSRGRTADVPPARRRN